MLVLGGIYLGTHSYPAYLYRLTQVLVAAHWSRSAINRYQTIRTAKRLCDLNFPIATGTPGYHPLPPPLLHLYIGGKKIDLEDDSGRLLSEAKPPIDDGAPPNWNADFFWGEEVENRSGHTSPNRGQYAPELSAAIAGYGALRRPCAVELFAPLEFAKKAAKWLPFLRTESWKKHLHTRFIENRKLWDELSELSVHHDTQIYSLSKTSDVHEFVGRVAPVTSAGNFFAWAGEHPPWHGSLGPYRPLNSDEASSPVCFQIADEDCSSDSRLQLIKLAASKLRP